ncbi:AMP-binding protein [Sessilibacter corallicola]|uniref:AMP-binding protein n=1 Tax=Sessilibacter corallicola TaxID=2904075 RepID=UPI001E3ECE69|nr:AMP-binding protein [Sessilibacter corallicola]MCE2029781.1 AMP-binding protein [Sessilibacter corallicola]
MALENYSKCSNGQDLIDWLEERNLRLTDAASRSEDLPAYIYLQNDGSEPLRLSHLEIIQKSKSLAALLQKNYSLGDRAILLYPSGLDYIIAFFACIYAGLIAVPAFPPNSRKRDWGRIDAIFENAAPALILTTSSLEENITQWQSEQSSAKQVSVVSTDVINDTATHNSDDASAWVRPETHSNSVAFLQYSSGSTGTPKGVMVTHANIRHNLKVIADGFSLQKADVGASWLPIYHDMGLIGSVLEPFEMGVSIYLMSPLDVLQKPIRWLQTISDYKVTASGGPNFIYEHCINRIKPEELEGLDLSSWKLAFNGAEPINAGTLKRFAETFAPCGFNAEAMTPCYGMAETTLMVSSCVRAQEFNAIQSQDSLNKSSLVSSGLVHPELSVKIVNPETQIECRDGETGEIWVHGNSVAQGYWQQDELTQETFSAKIIGGDDLNYLRTGDLGLMNEGELFVTGRIKELIIIRGQNHYPQDIESSVANSCEELNTCPGACFAIDVDGAEKLVIIHEINRSFMRKFDSASVLASVRKAVAENHQLQIHDLVLIKPASLLRTTSGKIRRVAMRDAFINNELNSVYQWSASDRQVPDSSTVNETANSNIVDVNSEVLNSKDTNSEVLNLKDKSLESIGSSISDSELDSTLNWLRRYAETRINSRLIDERRSIPPYIVLDMGNKGLMGMHVSKEDGGSQYSFQQAMRVYQQLGAIDPSLALFVGLGNVLGIRPLQKFASQRIRDTYLSDMAQGRVLAAFAITEPGAGSNPLAMSTQAVQDKDGNFVITGSKVWSGSAAWASVIHVFAKTYDANGNALGVTGFAVEQGLEGLDIGPEALTMGMRGTCQSRVNLNGVTVKPDAVLGEIGGGMEVAQDAMKLGRLVITAAAIGGMKKSVQLMVRYAQRRQVGTGLLLDNPISIERIQQLQHATDAVENLVNFVAQCLDKGIQVPIEMYAACKIIGPEYFWQGADHLIQMLGGRGYIENNIAPQLLRDARILRIFEGPTETLSMFLGARIHKASDEFFSFINDHFSAGSELETLKYTLTDLQAQAKQSSVFSKALDADRWAHERSGIVSALAALKIAFNQPESDTNQWIDGQIQKTLDNAKSYLSRGLKSETAILLERIAKYDQQIGDIQQHASGEDHALDDYLVKDPDAKRAVITLSSTPDFSVASVENAAPNSSGTCETLNAWMQSWVAKKLEVSASEIDVHQDFAGFGLDSVDAVELTTDLSSHFKIEVKADLAWVYPNINSASNFLATLIGEQNTDPSPVQETDDEKWLEGEI